MSTPNKACLLKNNAQKLSVVFNSYNINKNKGFLIIQSLYTHLELFDPIYEWLPFPHPLDR
jgi:hypothetical protein